MVDVDSIGTKIQYSGRFSGLCTILMHNQSDDAFLCTVRMMKYTLLLIYDANHAYNVDDEHSMHIMMMMNALYKVLYTGLMKQY